MIPLKHRIHWGPGEYEDISVRWDEPRAGIHIIHVNADDNSVGHGAVTERDEADNNTSYTFSPALGRISPEIPWDGTAAIRIPAGEAAPGTAVIAENLTTGDEVSAAVNDDGSLSFAAHAEITDRLRLTFTDPDGRSVTYIRPFRDPEDGTTVIGSEGGVVEGEEGIRAVVPPGAVPDATLIRIDAFSEADLSRPVPDVISFLGGIELVMDVVAEEELKLSIPLPPDSDLTPESQILVFEEIEALGETHFSLNNIARVKGNRIGTASPPFPGARTRGKFWMGATKVPVNFLAAQRCFIVICDI